MALTSQQVQANNVIAKSYLLLVVNTLTRFEEEHDIESISDMDVFKRRQAVHSAMCELKSNLTKYFHVHYTSGGEMSKNKSPDLSFTTNPYGSSGSFTLTGIPHKQ